MGALHFLVVMAMEQLPVVLAGQGKQIPAVAVVAAPDLTWLELAAEPVEL
jgi:hypothetical protein